MIIFFSCTDFSFFFGHTTQLVRPQLPSQRLNPCPLPQKHGVLTTAPLGKSLQQIYDLRVSNCSYPFSIALSTYTGCQSIIIVIYSSFSRQRPPSRSPPFLLLQPALIAFQVRCSTSALGLPSTFPVCSHSFLEHVSSFFLV